MRKVERIEQEASKLKVGELRRLVRSLQSALLVQESEAAEELSPAPAHEVIAVKHPAPGVTIKQEMVRCGKKNCRCAQGGALHGPYWYKYWNEGGRTRSKYLGKNLPSNGNGNGVHARPTAARAEPMAAHK